MPRRTRVLCLHGYAQSARMLEGKTATIRQALGENAEMVYIDAPNILLRPTVPSQKAPETSFSSHSSEPRSW
ncbi:hypothetical protein JCM11641_003479 [Rhodosporidiobolus odoratus]